MRLAVLDGGHRFGTKVLFAIIRAVSRRPVPEPVKLVMYRSDFYGTHMGRITQEAMRGPSAWSIADRELMAALVSTMNGSEYCIKAHSAVSAKAYGDEAKVVAALSDLDNAPINEQLRATLRMLQKLTRERTVSVEDMQSLLTAGISREQIRDSLAVCFVFDTINRLADTFKFSVGPPEDFEAGAQYLLGHGYR